MSPIGEDHKGTGRYAMIHDCEARGCDLAPKYRKVKRRALYMLEDYSDAECREVLMQMVQHYPQNTCEAICAYWSETIEGALKRERNAGHE